MNTIFLIVGRSGAGKTTLVTQLETISKLKSIPSYTTRPPRYEGELGHIFVGNYAYWNSKHSTETLVGFTVYNGHEYWATASQVEEHDLYVIDPAGVEFFKQNYRGNKQVKVVYIDADWKARYQRMRARGDSWWESMKRILHDYKWFDGWKEKADFVVINHDLTEAFTLLNNYILQFRDNAGHCEKYETPECLKCDDGYEDDGAIYCRRDHRG